MHTRKILTGYKGGRFERAGLNPRIAPLLNRTRQLGTFSRWPRLGSNTRRERATGPDNELAVDNATNRYRTNVSHGVASSVAAGRLPMVVFTGSPALLTSSWTGHAA